jgi:hypothetical protein
MARPHRPPPLAGIDAIVEARIAEAAASGAFDDLPGAGAPLQLEDDALVPEELRMAYRILRNAGFVPPEVEHLQAIECLERMVLAATDAGERRTAVTRLNMLLNRVAVERRGAAPNIDAAYFERIVARLDRQGGHRDG